ncbi:uncharacterized protein LOC27208639 isoform X5 [Drosophila simulans]|uniref:uncharacterized protein LOC27208639 isoform X5 n=1 Tax=Drosophila simulans TaxID=7240 RepID=UPI001D12DEA2|nr:uncharacterized protein LOC27208639 isoform X5 [Drosophila simulans]
MRNKFQAALRGVTRQYIIRQSWPRGREIFRTQLIIHASSTSPFTCRNYSKFSTHLSMERAMELLCNLDDEERSNLRSALGRLDADKEKKLYEKVDGCLTEEFNLQPTDDNEVVSGGNDLLDTTVSARKALSTFHITGDEDQHRKNKETSHTSRNSIGTTVSCSYVI